MYRSLIKKYNNQGSLITISSFPEQGAKYTSKQDALAGFAKNRLEALITKGEFQKIVVITSYINKPEIYEEDNFLVLRIFKRSTLYVYTDILQYLSKFDNIQNVLIEFEFASFGRTTVTSMFPLLLLALKLLKKHTTIELHQVLADLSNLSGHVGIKKHSLKSTFYNASLRMFYNLLPRLSKNIIVLEDVLNLKLKRLTRCKNIYTVHHGIDTHINRLKPHRKRHSSSAIKTLCFGYVTWYKGTDIAIKAASETNHLTVGGGQSITQKSQKHYQDFYNRVQKLLKENKFVKHTGFVDEKDIPKVFANTDLVLLPYRVFMSSSGPLSLSISNIKPFILSKRLRSYLKAPDFREGMKEFDIKKEDLLFQPNHIDLAKKITQIQKDKVLMYKMTKLSAFLNERRSYENLATLHAKIIKR